MQRKGFFTIQMQKQQTLFLGEKAGMYSISCDVCELYKQGNRRQLHILGEGKRDILIILECMNKGIERLFEEKLRRYGLDLSKDFYRLFVVGCDTPNNRQPTKKELKCCKSMVDDEIKKLKPKFIWLVGDRAIESFYMGRFKKFTVDRWRRRCIPDRMTGAWVMPMYHPSFIFHRNKRGDVNVESIFDSDLEWAMTCLNRGALPTDNVFENVHVLTEYTDVFDILKKIDEECLQIAFDYETTAISPYHTDAMIWSIGIAISADKGYSFPYQYKHWDSEQFDTITYLWQTILQNPNCKKIAQNLKFEDIWSFKVFDVNVQGWEWDTMIASHILETQNKSIGLKYQTYVRWGIEPYNDKISIYMKSAYIGGPNRLGEAPLVDLCTYNAADALFTYKLYKEQIKEVTSCADLYRAYRFFHLGLFVFSDIQKDGIQIDMEHYEQEGVQIAKRITKLLLSLKASEENKKFRARFGRDVNIRSHKDLSVLLFDVLGYTTKKRTGTGALSTDKEVLFELSLPYCKKLLLLKALIKIKDTYLAQYKRCSFKNKLHPFFDLHTTRTYRSSSSFPNFQNVPVRDETAKKVIRGGIIPSTGNKLVEWDYSGIEVRVAACYTRDPVLIDYLNTLDSDMHRDQAMDLFSLDNNQCTSILRSEIKSRFVFPEFYGSYYKTCAVDIFNSCFEIKTADNITVRKHLRNKGIIGGRSTEYCDFENHVKEIERKFWDKFSVFRAWQEKSIDFYRRYGYVQTMFGHRRGGVLTHNQIINTPFQATAFHCLLWSLIQINRIRKIEGWKTKIVGQIHDSGVYDLYVPEQEYVLSTTYDIACSKIKRRFSWIIVPFDIEIDITDIDGAWSTKKACEFKI